jgi:hypothetical protein
MTAPRDDRPGWFERAYALALYLLPRECRHEFGSAMQQLVRDLLKDARRSPARFAVIRLAVRLLPDLALTVAVQHAEAMRTAPPRRRFLVPALAAVALLAISSTGRISMLLGDAADDRQRLDHVTWSAAAGERAIEAARSLAASPQARDVAVAAMLLRVADDVAQGTPLVSGADAEAAMSSLKEADDLMVRALANGSDDAVVLAIATWHCPAAPAACQRAQAQARWRVLAPSNALAWWPAAHDAAPIQALERMAAARHATDPAWTARRIAYRALATTTTRPWPALDPRLPGEQATAWMLTRQAFENRRARRLGPHCTEPQHSAQQPDQRTACAQAAARLLELAATHRDQFSAAAVLRHLGVAIPKHLEADVAATEWRVARAADVVTTALALEGAADYPFGPAELAESLNVSNERTSIERLISRRGLLAVP